MPYDYQTPIPQGPPMSPVPPALPQAPMSFAPMTLGPASQWFDQPGGMPPDLRGAMGYSDNARQPGQPYGDFLLSQLPELIKAAAANPGGRAGQLLRALVLAHKLQGQPPLPPAVQAPLAPAPQYTTPGTLPPQVGGRYPLPPATGTTQAPRPQSPEIPSDVWNDIAGPFGFGNPQSLLPREEPLPKPLRDLKEMGPEHPQDYPPGWEPKALERNYNRSLDEPGSVGKKDIRPPRPPRHKKGATDELGNKIGGRFIGDYS